MVGVGDMGNKGGVGNEGDVGNEEDVGNEKDTQEEKDAKTEGKDVETERKDAKTEGKVDAVIAIEREAVIVQAGAINKSQREPPRTLRSLFLKGTSLLIPKGVFGW